MFFPGPTGWITAVAVKDFRHVFSAELFDVVRAVDVAKARVAQFEDRQHGGLKVERRAAELFACRDSSDGFFRVGRVREWLSSCSLVLLVAARRRVMDLERSNPGTVSLRTPAEGQTMDAFRKGWQATAYRALRQGVGALCLHARRRLDRWNVAVLPGHRLDVWTANVSAIRLDSAAGNGGGSPRFLQWLAHQPPLPVCGMLRPQLRHWGGLHRALRPCLPQPLRPPTLPSSPGALASARHFLGVGM